MSQEIHVTGLAELNKFLQELPIKVEKNILRGALRAGANVIRDKARSNLAANGSVKTGELQRGLKVSTRSKRGIVIAKVQASSTADNRALWLEYGTREHFISVQESEKPINTRRGIHKGKAVSMTTINRNVLQIGANFVGPTVHHPGARAMPYLRPALDGGAQDAILAAGNYIKDRLATKHGLDTASIEIEAT